MQLAGNSNRQQTYTPPLLAAILMLASLRSFSVNFRTFNMKKIITLFFMFITLAFATLAGNLKDFTEMVSIRSSKTGIFSAFRDTSKDPIDQNLEY